MAVYKTLPHYQPGPTSRPVRGVLLIAFVLLRPRRGLRAEATVEATAARHIIDETNRTQAGGGVVSQKVAKFTADDCPAVPPPPRLLPAAAGVSGGSSRPLIRFSCCATSPSQGLD